MCTPPKKLVSLAIEIVTVVQVSKDHHNLILKDLYSSHKFYQTWQDPLPNISSSIVGEMRTYNNIRTYVKLSGGLAILQMLQIIDMVHQMVFITTKSNGR